MVTLYIFWRHFLLLCPMVNLRMVTACVIFRFSFSLTLQLDILTTLPAPYIPPITDD